MKTFEKKKGFSFVNFNVDKETGLLVGLNFLTFKESKMNTFGKKYSDFTLKVKKNQPRLTC